MKNRKKFQIATTIILALMAIALTLSTFGAINSSRVLNSSGSIQTSPDIGVFSDSACTNALTTIDWGTISPGNNVTRTVYVKNTGTGVSLTLNLTAINWTPANANGPITMAWDKEGTRLAPGQSSAAVITLRVSSSITDITTFSVQISITGTA
ncbi:MAG: hypothetical protein ACE14S_12185 [Candidatus Bathyarchaeia archaeon]